MASNDDGEKDEGFWQAMAFHECNSSQEAPQAGFLEDITYCT